MADHVVEGRTGWPTGVKTRVKDMGDGTHALVTCVTGSTVSVTDDATVTMRGELADGTAVSPRIDSEDYGLLAVDEVTFGVNQGVRYIASYLVPHGSEIANDAALDILFITGHLAPHINIHVAVGGNSDLLIYENPTITNNGTSVIIRNKNRISTNTSAAVFYHTPTVGATGSSLLLSRFIAGGTGIAVVGGEIREPKWILNTSTTYLFRLTNRSGAAIQASISIEWDED